MMLAGFGSNQGGKCVISRRNIGKLGCNVQDTVIGTVKPVCQLFVAGNYVARIDRSKLAARPWADQTD
jgi:hypothetical protein